jgi:hypothetical protein
MAVKRGFFMSCVHQYDRLLREKPLATKCTSSAVIMSTCELVSQTILHRQHGGSKPVPPAAAAAPSGPLSSAFLQSGFTVGHVNVMHCGAFGVLSGAVWLAPVMHAFYLLSASWFVPLRILVNSLVVDPINYTMAMMINSLAHGEGLAKGATMVEAKLYDTILAGFAVWPAAQVVNFYFVPLHWRVLFFNGVSLVWNSYLAWTVGLSRHQGHQHQEIAKSSSSSSSSSSSATLKVAEEDKEGTGDKKTAEKTIKKVK